MKVTVIANGFQEDYTINLINSLVKQNLEIDFIGSNIYPENKIDSGIRFFNVRKIDPGGKKSFRKFFWVLKYFSWLFMYYAKEKKNIVHVQWLRFPIIDGVFFSLSARLFGHKVVYTAHDVLPHDNENYSNRLIFKLIYKTQNFIVVHTEYIRQRIINEFNIKPGKIKVIKHGVYELNGKLDIDPVNFKHKLKIREEEFVLLFFGMLKKYKGLDLLAESFNMVREQEQFPIRLIVAGEAHDGYEKEIKQIADQHLKEAADLYIRFIKEEELNTFFGAADVTILPYREASQSGVMFMSFAHGVPVIVPDLGGFPDDVIAGKTGLIFEKGNSDELKNRILEAYSIWGVNNERLKSEIAEITKKKYSWNASAEELKNIYQSISS